MGQNVWMDWVCFPDVEGVCDHSSEINDKEAGGHDEYFDCSSNIVHFDSSFFTFDSLSKQEWDKIYFSDQVKMCFGNFASIL